MKKIHKILPLLTLLLTLLLLLVPGQTWAREKQELIKKISKVYATKSDPKILTENLYGNTTVVLWDENKIAVEVVIKVKAKTVELTQKVLDNIDIDIQGNSQKVSAITKVKMVNNWMGNNINANYEINYTVKIPKMASVDLSQKYGNIYVDALWGSSKITCKYGNLLAGDLNHKDNDVVLAYSSKSAFRNVDQMQLNSSYSTAVIAKINHLKQTGNYNSFKISNAGTVDLTTNYSDLTQDVVQRLKISGNYLTLNVGKIGKFAGFLSNYSKINLGLGEQCTGLDIVGNYTNTVVSFTSTKGYRFDIKTNYGSLDSKSKMLDYKVTTQSQSKTYSGYVNQKDEDKINISGSYSNIHFK